MQAFAIQAADIGLYFGTIGAGIGVVAGLLLNSFGPALFGAKDEADDFSDALERVAEVSANIEDVMDVLELSVRDLSEIYGAAAVQVRQFALAQAEIAVDQASRRLADQITIMDDLLDSYRESYWSVSQYESRVSELVGTMDVTRYQARQLAEAIANIGDGATFEDQVRAMEDLVTLAKSMGVEISDLPPEIQDALSEMITLARETSRAEQAARVLEEAVFGVSGATAAASQNAVALAANMSAAAAAFSRVQAQEAKTYSGRGGDPRDFMDGGSKSDYESAQGYTTVDEIIGRLTPKSGGSGGGGGGTSEVDRVAESYDRLMRSLDPALDAMREFEESQKILDDALDAGVITLDEYVDGMDMLEAQFGSAADAAKQFEETASFAGDTIIDIAMNGADAVDDLAESLQRAALQAALLGEGPLAGIWSALGGADGGIMGQITAGLVPSAKGNVFSRGRIIPHARGGVVAQTSYFPMANGNVGSMAENGPEAIMPLERGPDGKLGVLSQGGGAVNVTYSPNIDARGASDEAVARLAEIVARNQRDFAANVQSVIKQSGLRGR